MMSTYVLGNGTGTVAASLLSDVGGKASAIAEAVDFRSHGAPATPRTNWPKNAPDGSNPSGNVTALPRSSPGCSSQIAASSPRTAWAARTGSSVTSSELSIAPTFGSETSAVTGPEEVRRDVIGGGANPRGWLAAGTVVGSTISSWTPRAARWSRLAGSSAEPGGRSCAHRARHST